MKADALRYDFWLVARDFALDDEWVTDFLRENNREVVMQDVVALDLLEELIAADGDAYQELSINIDSGGLAARRAIKKLLDAQDVQAR
jgi:vanillate O-demethylase monooxygenase subunit